MLVRVTVVSDSMFYLFLDGKQLEIVHSTWLCVDSG